MFSLPPFFTGHSAARRPSHCGRAVGDVGEVRRDSVLLCGLRRVLGALPHRHQEHGYGLLLHGCSGRNHQLPIHHLSGSVTRRSVRKPRLHLLLPSLASLCCASSSSCRPIQQSAAIHTNGQFGYLWFHPVSPSARDLQETSARDNGPNAADLQVS